MDNHSPEEGETENTLPLGRRSSDQCSPLSTTDRECTVIPTSPSGSSPTGTPPSDKDSRPQDTGAGALRKTVTRSGPLSCGRRRHSNRGIARASRPDSRQPGCRPAAGAVAADHQQSVSTTDEPQREVRPSFVPPARRPPPWLPGNRGYEPTRHRNVRPAHRVTVDWTAVGSRHEDRSYGKEDHRDGDR